MTDDPPVDHGGDGDGESDADAVGAVEPATKADEAKPKRFYDRGLFWLAVVIVVAGVALGVSFLAEEPTPDEAAAPKDITAFCVSAKALSEVPTPSLNVGEPATDFRTLQQTLDALALQSPASIAKRINAVKESLDPVIAQAEEPGADDPNAVNELAALLDAQSAGVADDDAAVSFYIQKHCGFDPNAG